MTIEQRFWSKVDRQGDDQCWRWLGSFGPSGYGRFYRDGKAMPAHRVAWELRHDRAMEDGLDACHSCDNRWCVNPAHIWPGTRAENMRDSLEKGRHRMSKRNRCKRGRGPLKAASPKTHPPSTRTAPMDKLDTGAFSKFKDRRMELGFTLRDVERITGREISNAYLSQFENGKIKHPSAHVILCLCAAYGVSYEDALSWLQIPVVIRPPTICGECGQAIPLRYAIDERQGEGKSNG